MKEIKPQQMSRNVFDAIGKDWMLVAAEADGRANAMTASWGGMGVLWNKCVAFVFIRPQRFTKTLIDKADTLSLSFFADDERAMLTYMGRTSGRDEDKLTKQNLTYSAVDGAPVFDRAELTLVCRKLYRQTLTKDGFFDQSLIKLNYPNGDLHDVYVVEIEKVLVGE